ncbi:DUF2752 domain-containing protein [Actinomadura keratinilytica]|uniref:DUF2752 domain-containing protein n=1 Tax=Actinomadura keratinilytica TaxID=547461 RepID=UPI00360D0815
MDDTTAAPARAAQPHPHAPAPAGRRSRGRALVGPGIVLAAAAAGVALVSVVDPHEPGHYPTCPLLWATGLYCPGCGGLRMVNSLTHGRVGEAFGLNPWRSCCCPSSPTCGRAGRPARPRAWRSPPRSCGRA